MTLFCISFSRIRFLLLMNASLSSADMVLELTVNDGMFNFCCTELYKIYLVMANWYSPRVAPCTSYPDTSLSATLWACLLLCSTASRRATGCILPGTANISRFSRNLFTLHCGTTEVLLFSWLA